MMRAALLRKGGAPFEIVSVPVPTPTAGQVLIKVEACGVCHGDIVAKMGFAPKIKYPIIPGHEYVGKITALGPEVTTRKIGQKVGVGWYGGSCGSCFVCHDPADTICCPSLVTTGLHIDGGYAEYAVASAEATALVPEDLPSSKAAPLMCAGLTVFNALRRTHASPGQLVAVSGIGGLGHLAIQYSKRMGYRTVAISTSSDKAALAKELGADHFIDSSKEDIGKALVALGGAKVAVVTVPSAKGIAALLPGMTASSQILVAGADHEPIGVTPLDLIPRRITIVGVASGNSHDAEDTLSFSKLANINVMIEEYPLEKAAEAYDRMISNKARFRVVIKP